MTKAREIAELGQNLSVDASGNLDFDGTVTADGLTVDGSLGDWSIDSQGVIQTFTRPSTSYIRASDASGNISIQAGGSINRALFASNGDISFYEDTGTTAKLFWDASAESLGIGTSSPDSSLHVDDAGSFPITLTRNGGANTNTSIRWKQDTTSWYAGTNSSNSFAFRYDSPDLTTGNALTITSSDNVGIGTSSPASLVTGGSSPVLSIGGTDSGLTNGEKAGSLSFITSDGSYTGTYSDGITGEIASIAETAVGGGYGLAFYTGVTTGSNRAERVRIDMTGNVGIGTSSPSAALDVLNGSGDGEVAVFSGTDSDRGLSISTFAVGGFGQVGVDLNAQYSSSPTMTFSTGGSERLRIDSSGRVGIRNSNPSIWLDVNGTSSGALRLKHFYSYAQPNWAIKMDGQDGTSAGYLSQSGASGGFALADGAVYYGGGNYKADANATSYAGIESTNGEIRFRNATGLTGGQTFSGSETMRIDSSGNVGIGTSSPTGGNSVLTIKNVNGTGAQINFRNAAATDGYIGLSGDSNGDLIHYLGATADQIFYTSGSERMRIDSSGNVGVGESSPTASVHISKASGGSHLRLERTNATTGGAHGQISFSSVNGIVTGIDSVADGDSNGGHLRFYTTTTSPQTSDVYGLSERMRIDSSGNLGVATTTSTVSSSGNSGLWYQADSYFVVARDSATPMYVNRIGTDGGAFSIRKNGSTVGSIGVGGSSGGIGISGGLNNDAGLFFYAGTSAIRPSKNISGIPTPTDNYADLGASSVRWDDIYATNGTIQTSDRNEKQDIAALTATEMLVAARISAMFKTFRWIDKVADNPNARTHTGIIAQDVQQAFTDEGLDAGNYSLFISTTWWEANGETYDTQADAPAGATERTRMGIRYPELLSFIAAYNDQRFTSIEARLTALEG